MVFDAITAAQFKFYMKHVLYLILSLHLCKASCKYLCKHKPNHMTSEFTMLICTPDLPEHLQVNAALAQPLPIDTCLENVSPQKHLACLLGTQSQ